MAKIYFVRHQAGGVLWETPFAESPSEGQIAAIKKLAAQSHGAAHPKTDEPYWLTVCEVDVLGSGDVPSVPDRAPGVSVNAAAVGEFQVSGVGTVSSKEV